MACLSTFKNTFHTLKFSLKVQLYESETFFFFFKLKFKQNLNSQTSIQIQIWKVVVAESETAKTRPFSKAPLLYYLTNNHFLINSILN